LLKASNLNYVGFVEGNDIYKGTVDLVVCDGFEGNIALKASEGSCKFIHDFVLILVKFAWLFFR
jgi:glycerol-3-phosphate acyltransferase PlsX